MIEKGVLSFGMWEMGRMKGVGLHDVGVDFVSSWLSSAHVGTEHAGIVSCTVRHCSSPLGSSEVCHLHSRLT